MINRKSLTALTAAALVSGIGLAYAQTDSSSTAAPAATTAAPADSSVNANTATPQGSLSTGSSMNTAPADTTTNAPADMSTSPNTSASTSADSSFERAPQADRN
jgi:hypothetical protein